MKLAFSTLGCPDWTLEQILRCAQENGYQAIELRGLKGEMHIENMTAFDREHLAATIDALRARGLTISDLGSSASFHEADKAEAHYQEAKREIAQCARCGIAYLRVFGNSIGDQDEKETLARIATYLKRLCEDARGTDVSILLEIHGEINTIERVKSLLEQVNDDKLGILWDIEHSDKVYGDAYEPFYEAIRPWIRHVHIKDSYVDASGERKLCAVGAGRLPIRSIVERMLADGYDGYFSLEWEKKWHPELDGPEAAFPAYAAWMRANINA